MLCRLKTIATVASATLLLSTAGCSLPGLFRSDDDVSDSDQGATKSGIVQASHESSASPRVANPQAKMIRFDGQEFVLGNGEIQGVTIEALQAHVKALLKAERRRSATALVALHRSAAHRCVVSRWATSPDDSTVVFMAQALDRLEFAESDSYSSLLSQSRARREKAKAFADSRSKCIASLHRGGTAVRDAGQTVKLAEAFGHPLPMVDAARLEGLACLAAGKSDDAQASFRRGLALAEQHRMTATYAELALLASDAALTTDDEKSAKAFWKAAVVAELSSMATEPEQPHQLLSEMDSVFWLQAERLKPAGVEWPAEVSLTVSPWVRRLDFPDPANESASTTLLSAIAQAQLASGQPELALVAFKRAESTARSSTAPWLRIAQARCLAAQNQFGVATTILSSPASSKDTRVRVAALAALGSIKMHSGAYEQGAEILNRTLTENPTVKWSGRLDAEADLAAAQLILGDLDEALESLHAVQQNYHLAGRWQALLQSLSNESRLLTEEGRTEAARAISTRITALEDTAI